MSPRDKINLLRQDLKSHFLERDEIIDGLLTAVIAKKHILLLGPPGTGKSALIESLVGCIDNASVFTWLLTKFTSPDELFGPVKVSALKNDSFMRATVKKLPEAHFVYLDEVFKASSAILNALLRIMNERKFENDTSSMLCPLNTLVGASNETPEDASLTALYDRFTLRYWVPYISNENNLTKLLFDPFSDLTTKLNLNDIEAAQIEASSIVWSDKAKQGYLQIIKETHEAGIRPSDRRWKELTSVIKASAWLENSAEVCFNHLEILADTLWDQPKDRSKVQEIVSKIVAPANLRMNQLIDLAKAEIKKLPTIGNDSNSRAAWIGSAANAKAAIERMLGEADDLIKTYGSNTKIDKTRLQIEDMVLSLSKQASKVLMERKS